MGDSPCGKIDTNYARPHIRRRRTIIANDQWKEKNPDDIWDIHISEVLFAKWAKHNSAILVDKVFDTTTEDDIIEFIDDIYM